MEQDRDVQLMLAVKKGDKRAFEELFERNYQLVYRFLLRMLRKPELAEEGVQEVFIKLYLAAPSYKAQGKFLSFLYRIAYNYSLNELRKKEFHYAHESIDSSGNSDGSAFFQLKVEGDVQEERIFYRSLTQKLEEWIGKLPPQQRAALLMHRVDGLSYQEIADALGISLGAVKSLIHRAKKNLQRQLSDFKENRNKNSQYRFASRVLSKGDGNNEKRRKYKK